MQVTHCSVIPVVLVFLALCYCLQAPNYLDHCVTGDYRCASNLYEIERFHCFIVSEK